MRILHVTPLYHPFVGGAESYTREVSERLARRGHDVTVLTMNVPASQHGHLHAPSETLNGVRVRRFAPAGRLQAMFAAGAGTSFARRAFTRTGCGDSVDLWARSPFGVTAALYAVRTTPDVVSVVNWYGGWLPLQMLYARRWRRFGFVGVPLFHTECRWAHAPVNDRVLRQCDAVIAMTEHERLFMEAAAGRAHAIGAGIDPATFQNADGLAIRSRYGIGNAPLVGYIGRMDASKGVDVLVRAFRSVWRRLPDARLLLAGASADGTGGPSDVLRGLADDERARVIATGRFAGADKASLFDALDVFAMPSRAESFGIAYLEAWMRKKPVIGTRLDSTRCVIDEGVDGHLVTPGDADELAACIVMLLGNRDRRRQLGEQGYAKAVSRFTWDAIVDHVERVYRQARARAVAPASAEGGGAAAAAHAGRESG